MVPAAAANAAVPDRPTFFDEDRNDRESGKRIEPCDMECRINNEADQCDERKLGAGSGLHCISAQRRVPAAAGLMPL
jgi:hypothetical protein